LERVVRVAEDRIMLRPIRNIQRSAKSMATTYDAKIIATMADRMYSEAANIVGAATLLWGFIGLLLGAAGGYAASRVGPGALIGGAVGAILFGAVGYNRATALALDLRFRAQQALVMVEIERNTRARAL
jgi:hypothetical protein